MLELSLGNYRQAFGHAQYVADEDLFVWGTYVLPDLVEAAVRCNERAAARRAVERLSARARASGAPWGLGLLAYSRALLAEEADAEQFHQEAIAVLDTTRAVTDLARAHLVYGEWLRRQRRRRDARTHLRTAHEMLADMGADAFAERARIELEATGEHAHQRNTRPAFLLTPRETQIARLVSAGHNNRDIASQLFVSPSTVDYHLRNIFLKLGVKSRTQLAHNGGSRYRACWHLTTTQRRIQYALRKPEASWARPKIEAVPFASVYRGYR